MNISHSRNALSRREIHHPIARTFSQKTCFLLFLGTVVFLLSLLLIYVKDQYRQHFIALEKLKAQHVQLETQWSELLLEESTWSARTRVTELATHKLGMIQIQPANIRMLTLEQLQADDPANNPSEDETDTDN
jgi:cell division protein FtsL